MSKNLKESETLKNLMRAFAGESQARNRYTFAAGCANSSSSMSWRPSSPSPPTRRRSTPKSSTTT